MLIYRESVSMSPGQKRDMALYSIFHYFLFLLWGVFFFFLSRERPVQNHWHRVYRRRPSLYLMLDIVFMLFFCFVFVFSCVGVCCVRQWMPGINLNLVVAKLVDYLAGGLRVPKEIAACAEVDDRTALWGPPVRVSGRLTSDVTRRTAGLAAVRQHPVLRLRGAPVHRLSDTLHSRPLVIALFRGQLLYPD